MSSPEDEDDLLGTWYRYKESPNKDRGTLGEMITVVNITGDRVRYRKKNNLGYKKTYLTSRAVIKQRFRRVPL